MGYVDLYNRIFQSEECDNNSTADELIVLMSEQKSSKWYYFV